MHSTGFKFACLVVRFFVVMSYLFAGAAVFRTLDKKESHGYDNIVYVDKSEYLEWLHFTFSCTTTIGYGDVTPNSNAAKIFFIFYALIGIPMMLWYLALSGEIQTRLYRAMLSRLGIRLRKKDQRVYKDIIIVILSSFIFIIYWLIGAALSRQIKDADYPMTILDSLYFWFVTFSTNGFGDIILPRIKHGSTIFLLCLLFKLFGFNLVAGIIHSVVVWINDFDEKRELCCCSCWNEDAMNDPGHERYKVAFATTLETSSAHVEIEDTAFTGTGDNGSLVTRGRYGNVDNGSLSTVDD